MAQSKEQLNKLLIFIEQLIKQPGNEWFADELCCILCTDDIHSIRKVLEIRGKSSISYDFIKQERLKKQLIIDNLRMENAALNLQEKEIYRFYVFCVNAFYQLENVVNYYLHTLYPDIDKLLKIVEDKTQNEKEGYRFKRSTTDKNISDISISHKLTAVCNILFPEDKSLKIKLSNLRQVRNKGEHRCNVINEEKNKEYHIDRFLKSETFDSIRILLKKTIDRISEDLQNGGGVSVCGTIKTLLQSACCVEYNGQTELLPDRLFGKIKGNKVGDNVEISLNRDGKITDINNLST